MVRLRRFSCLLVPIFLLASTPGVFSFNVDTLTANVFTEGRGSKFGFSVAQHKEGNVGWLLAGAPEAQTDQPGVVKGGAVYRCPLSPGSLSSCQPIPFDRNGSRTVTPTTGDRKQSDEKSHQWFGASLQSSGIDGVIVACAPRYVYYTVNLRRRDPVGTCWISRRSFSNFEEYSPCKTLNWGYHKQGSCQAGFSAAVTPDGKRLFVGGVGSWYWQGQVFSNNLEFNEPHFSTREGPKSDDDTYLGYSLAVGEFSGDEVPDVVVGIPRGNNLTGKVALYNSGLINLLNISGDQIGSYYGYAVAATDVDGDGLDDILVGAPLYSDEERKGRIYEEGRVYIFYQNKDHQFPTKSVINGMTTKGRFGLSVTAMGDVNQDGYKDFAVGAPYGGDDGSGAVYIYLGGRRGPSDKYSQMITPKNLEKPGLKTFGFSLSGGLDLDNNEYPDLVVGAYASDSAVYLRSRPVINVTSSLRVEPESIALGEKNCKLHDQTEVTCVTLNYCLEYDGKGADKSLTFQYEVRLDATKPSSRAFMQLDPLQREQNHTVVLTRGQPHCKEIYTYLQNNIRDKLHPLTMQVTHYLVDPAPSHKTLKPILNQELNATVSKLVNIQQNCGPDNICTPDLALTVIPSIEEYVVGDKRKLELEVEVTNRGEDAFEAIFHLQLPMDVHYINVKTKDDHTVTCTGAQPDTKGVNELACEIGNPLQSKATTKFRVILSPSKTLSSSIGGLQLTALVNSTNDEKESTIADNEVVVSIPVRVDLDLSLRGISEPDALTHNVSHSMPKVKYNEADIGPEIVHKYEVLNKGPSAILEGEIHILWPSHNLNGDPIMYLMDQPEVRGNAKCEPFPEVNEIGLTKVKRTRSLDSSGLVSVQDLLVRGSPEDQDRERRERALPQRRRRRNVAVRNRRASLESVSCDSHVKCSRIVCSLKALKADEHVLISLRTRLWTDSLNDLKQDEYLVESKVAVKATQLPYDFDPSLAGLKVYTVVTKVSLLGVVYPLVWGVPWWAILLAVLLGLILLILILVLLIKCGFFKRKKVEDEAPEKEPLKTNGYQMGKRDVAL